MKRLGLLTLILSFIFSFCNAEGIRIISLSPATTEILFSLGLGNNIIANTIWCDYPEQAKQIKKIGTFSEPNIEMIVSMKPDIVFATGLEQAPVVNKLRAMDIKVFVSDPENFQELFNSVIEIGRLTGKQSEAKNLVDKLKEKLDFIGKKTQNIPDEKKPKVFVEIWGEPLMTAGKGSIIDELIGIAGGLNIAHDTPKPYSRFSSEVVIDRDPDFIILGYMAGSNTKYDISKRIGWKNIKAVKNNHIIMDMTPEMILRPGPRMVEGAEFLHSKFYDER
ncbi:MAG: cobalamin-binding protein [Candidatus Omnitrophota bacterium]|jgi:iron complex transport system substrate-binding protein|nr:MAG: cobalamin-binding protein [Candidatus Omnitrophota bacterium]